MALNRKMVLSLAGLALTTMMLLIAIVPSSSRGAPATGRETLYVESFSSSGIPPVVSTAAALTAGVHYTVKVRGTYSAWGVWPVVRKGLKCGQPRLAPAYPSPGRKATQTGFDAEFKFAIPSPNVKVCAAAGLPRKAVVFQINPGTKWAHPTLKSGVAPTVPAVPHLYIYDVVGQGKPLSLRIVDYHATDNNGRFRVTIAPS